MSTMDSGASLPALLLRPLYARRQISGRGLVISSPSGSHDLYVSFPMSQDHSLSASLTLANTPVTEYQRNRRTDSQNAPRVRVLPQASVDLVSAVGNGYAPTPDANSNRYFRPSVAALLLVRLPTLRRTSTIHNPTRLDSNMPHLFYTVQELDAHFLKDPEVAVPSIPG